MASPPDRDDAVKLIRSRGYWRINIHPAAYEQRRIEPKAILELTRKCVVELRGWDYPHFHDDHGSPHRIEKGIEKTIVWKEYGHIEHWRMTYSGNFFHLLAIGDDWREGKQLTGLWGTQQLANKHIGVLATLFRITEAFEFALRLSREGIFNSGVVLSLTLNDLKDRELYIDDPKRVGMSMQRLSKSDSWNYRKTFELADFSENCHKHSLDAFIELAYLFNWEQMPSNIFRADQEKFLARKFT